MNQEFEIVGRITEIKSIAVGGPEAVKTLTVRTT